MRVLHVDEQTGWRGGEQQASWLLQGLAERGHYVAIAARRESPFITNAHGGADVTRHLIALRSELDIGSARALARIIEQDRIDILHAHSSHAHALACYGRWLAGKGKVVVSRRVSFPPKSHFLNHLKYRMPDLYLSVSQKVDDVLAQYGIPEAKRRVVHSSVDLHRLEVPPISREDLGVPASGPLLVNAGALVGHKDHTTLIEAMALVAKALPEAHLAIAGEGELRPQVEARIRGLDLGGRVTLLGHRTDVPAIVRAADVYVSSSWSEGLGTSVLEALACETPVVAAVAGGIPEMIIDGKTGFLVPNKDPEALAQAILASLKHRENARAMAAAGRGLVEEQFTVTRMVEGTLAAYNHLLKLR